MRSGSRLSTLPKKLQDSVSGTEARAYLQGTWIDRENH